MPATQFTFDNGTFSVEPADAHNGIRLWFGWEYTFDVMSLIELLEYLHLEGPEYFRSCVEVKSSVFHSTKKRRNQS